MGSFHSIPSRSERRRTNRLSKPLTNKANSSPISPKSSAATSQVSSPLSPCSPTWKDPWNGNSIPINPPVSGCHGFLPQSVPHVNSQPENSRGAVAWNTRSEPTINESHDEHHYGLSSPTSGTAAFVSRRPSLQPRRRASVQPDSSRSHSQSFVNPRQPKRSYSLQSYSQGTKSPIHENILEEATSSNTYFVVDSQRFSITRRRSLLTRPGVATRNSSSRQSIRRPSVVGSESKHSSRRSNSLQPESEDSVAKPISTSTRPDTPGDIGYTHLGALKLGSLRVVNRSTSPCPSDQTQSNIPPNSSPEASDNVSARRDHSEDLNGRGSIQDHSQTPAEGFRRGHKSFPEDISNLVANRALTSLLQLPSLSHRKGQEDIPGSPFSFEKSPTMAPLPNQDFSQEDEGISIMNEGGLFDSDTIVPGNTPMRGSSRRKPSRPLAKADSGYSSATSVRSLRGKHTGWSVNSQHFEPGSWESCNLPVDSGIESHNVNGIEKSGSVKELPIQRRLSLRDPKPSYYSSALDGFPTTCGIQPVRSNSFTRSSSLTVPRGLRRTMSSARPYAPLNSLDSPVSNTEEFIQSQRVEATGGRLSCSYPNWYASKPSGFRRSHHRSISTPNPNKQRGPGAVQNCRVDANAPSCKQWQNLQISTTKHGPPRQFMADMANQKCIQSNDNLPSGALSSRLNTEASLPGPSSFILGQMETVEEKDPGTLPEASGDMTRDQDIKNQQRRFARPCRRRNDIHMATSPFIFH